MKKIVIVTSVLFLSACAQFEPFVDARREAGQVLTVGQSTPNRVAICYNPLWSDEKEIEKLAVDACAQTKRKPQFNTKKYFTCTLASQFTVFYKCI